uniref:Uncharacterized protein n=1 Tax=Anguilla anguilla TaxID=7936 RepID=A0A0E9SZD3_ANGAN
MHCICMQRICSEVLNMTTFIYITLVSPKHYGAYCILSSLAVEMLCTV